MSCHSAQSIPLRTGLDASVNVSAVQLQHQISLPEGGVATGLLWDVLVDSMSGECIACIGDLLIPLPAEMEPRLRKLIGQEVVLAKVEGYRVAPRRSRSKRGWG